MRGRQSAGSGQIAPESLVRFGFFDIETHFPPVPTIHCTIFAFRPEPVVVAVHRSTAEFLRNWPGTATSAIWNVTWRACVTIFAPIFTSFCLRLASDQ